MIWLQILGPPLLMTIGGIFAWIIRSKTEEFRQLEEKLRAERRKIYADILDPFIRLLSGIKKGTDVENIVKNIVSYDYRKTAFELNLFGSDEVIQAYNDLMQYTFHLNKTEKADSSEIMQLWGRLLLAIRKSLGNKETKLHEKDMLRGMIVDIDEFLPK